MVLTKAFLPSATVVIGAVIFLDAVILRRSAVEVSGPLDPGTLAAYIPMAGHCSSCYPFATERPALIAVLCQVNAILLECDAPGSPSHRILEELPTRVDFR